MRPYKFGFLTKYFYLAHSAISLVQVGSEGEIQPVVGRTVPPLQYGLSLERNLGPHDPSSLIKCCESLAFLVRDVAHITPYNFDECVHCIRTFVEAGLNASKSFFVFKAQLFFIF